jgi:hypothetical protein
MNERTCLAHDRAFAETELRLGNSNSPNRVAGQRIGERNLDGGFAILRTDKGLGVKERSGNVGREKKDLVSNNMRGKTSQRIKVRTGLDGGSLFTFTFATFCFL